MNNIEIVWSVEDVLNTCEWLTTKQALNVLHNLKENHDANIGINWNVIYYTAQSLYPEDAR